MANDGRATKLENWAHLAEILASVAVVITLIVLVHEVASSTESQERQMQLDRFMNYTDTFLGSSQLAEVYAKVKEVDGLEPLASAYAERYDLSPAEAVLWSRQVQRGLFIWHSDFLFAGPSEALERELAFIPTYPDLLLAYQINEDNLLSPEFIEYVDEVLSSR